MRLAKCGVLALGLIVTRAGWACAAPLTPALSTALFGALVRDTRAGNVVLAPASLQPALALLARGSAGLTAAQIRALAGDAPLPVRPDGAAVSIRAGTAVWAAGLDASSAFARVARRDFAATVFSGPAALAPGALNGWVSRMTDGLIRTISPARLAPGGFVLAEAVLFTGRWATPFDPAATLAGRFSADGHATTVRMMQRSGRTFTYAHPPGFQAVDLAYGSQGYGCTILLPDKVDGADALAEQLPAAWADLPRQLSAGADGMLKLPRIAVRFDVNLVSYLRHAGMTAAFDGRADFTPVLSPGRSRPIDAAEQTVIVKMDEQGTIAAAATVVSKASVVGRQTQPPFSMIADHPYVFVIHGVSLSDILFIGLVRSP